MGYTAIRIERQEALDSRERVFLALNHQEPDRIPIDCWVSRGTKRKIESAFKVSYEEFLDLHDVDLRYIEGPAYVGPDLSGTDVDMDVDIWGVPRKQVDLKLEDGGGQYIEIYKEVIRSPLQSLKTVEEIVEYELWPSPDWFDYSVIEGQCKKIKGNGRVVVFMGDRLNRLALLKAAMYLRGFEQIFVDLLMNPEIAKTIFQKIKFFYLEYGNRILESAKGKIDILCTGDDFGSQNGPLLSPSLWSEYLEEGFAEYIRMGNMHGVYVMHHTCGSVYDLLPKMVNCDLDILQSLQPEANNMDPYRIKKEFGSKLSFHGGVSC